MITLVQVMLSEDDVNFQFPEPDLSNIILKSFSYAGTLTDDQKIVLAKQLVGEIKSDRKSGDTEIFCGEDKSVYIRQIQFLPIKSLQSTVRVTKHVLAQADKDVSQASITTTGPIRNKVGIFRLTVDDMNFTLNKKTKDAGIWATHQGEDYIRDFERLFNLLEVTPDKPFVVAKVEEI